MKNTDTPEYKSAYKKAYENCQDGGMNNTESHEVATEQAERASVNQETKPATARPKIQSYTNLEFNALPPKFRDHILAMESEHAALCEVAEELKAISSALKLVNDIKTDAPIHQLIARRIMFADESLAALAAIRKL